MIATQEQSSPRWLLILSFIAGLFLAWLIIATPLDPPIQALFGLFVVAGIFMAGRLENRLVITVLTILAFLFATRYIYWRLTETLDFDGPLAAFFGIGLIAAELYLWTVLIVTFVQAAWPLGRKPEPLPEDMSLWPTIDLYIPTYNEDLDLVAKTVYAAKDLEYPPEKLRIYILDDGRRDEFRAFADRTGVGYITRDTNEHAKAGNLNNAVRQTNGEIIAILDCDHIPTRWFLQLTAGWFLRNPEMALVQTPHHFYNRDPFIRNLETNNPVPSEGLLFYGLVQDGNDFWNACFFCGSCALLRRTAIESIGGFAVETVTEDAHTALKLHRMGWESAFVRFPMAAGLATETLGRFIGQRIRWARGMIQILRMDSPILKPGLTLAQRCCYLSAMMHFLFPLPRFVLLTAPLAYLLLDVRIIAASAAEVFTYALPYLFIVIYVNWRIQGKFRHTFWSDVYETSLTLHLLWPTIKTFIKPHGGKFGVTSKGGSMDETYFDYRLMLGHMVVVGALLTGIGFGISSLYTDFTALFYTELTEPERITTRDQIMSTFLNLFWASVSMLYFSAALATARELSQENDNMIRAEMPGVVWLGDGRTMAGMTAQLSSTEFVMSVPKPEGEIGEDIHIDAEAAGDRIVLPARVLSWEGDQLRGIFAPSTEEEDAALVRLVYGRGDAWVDWDKVVVVSPFQALGDIASSIRNFFSWSAGRLKYHTVDRATQRVSRSVDKAAVRPSAKSILENAMREAAQQSRTLIVAAAAAAVLLISSGGSGLAQPVPGEEEGNAPTRLRLPQVEEPASAPDPLQQGLGISAEEDEGRTTLQSAPPLRPSVPSPVPSIFEPQSTPVSEAADSSMPADLMPLSDERRSSDKRVISLTLRDLGAEPAMELRNGSIRGIPFSIRNDEVITEAQLSLNLTFSPNLLAGRSQLVVLLNGEGIKTIELDPSYGTTQTETLEIDPFLIQTNNELLFEFRGEGAEQQSSCPGAVDANTWVKIGHLSKFVLSASRFRVRNDLALMPSPFFDPSDPTRLVLHFVLGENPSLAMVRAAGIVASYWGMLADFRGAYFPVAQNDLPTSNAVVFARPGRGPRGVTLPRIDGPSIAIVDNPAAPSAKLLLVMGRNDAEIVHAAQALAESSAGLSGPVITVAPPEIMDRRPYDAPRWAATDRPVLLGELTTQRNLEARGLTPGVLDVNFRTSPDIFLWSDKGIPVTVRYRYPQGPWIDAVNSRLDVLINDVYVDSLPLVQSERGKMISAITLNDYTQFEGTVQVPPFQIGGQNRLQFYFAYEPIRGDDECVDVAPADVRSVIDVNSEVDLSRVYRQARMPNLAFLTQAGFPFTRLADLSETAIVVPEIMRKDDLEAVLTLMGLFGARTGVAGHGVNIVTHDRVQEFRNNDLILIGSWDRQPLLREWGSRFGYERRENSIVVPGARAIEQGREETLSSWFYEPTTPNAVTLRTASVKAGMASFRSPLDRDRTVVALMSSEGNPSRPLLNALTSPDLNPLIQGDLVVAEGDTITSYRVTEQYVIGDLPFTIWVRWYLSDKPVAMIGLAAFAGLLLGFPVFTWLRSSANRKMDAS